MARFTNFATLSYNGGTTESNTVVGELVQTLSAVKTAVGESYEPRGDVAYVLSLVNSGASALTDLTITDDLGGYAVGTGTVYPLTVRADSLRYFVNGVLQAAPTVTADPPMTISGVSVPAGGSAVLVYEADITAYAPLGTEAEITNTATVTGGGLTSALTAQETIGAVSRASLGISKALSPSTVTENGRLTYTFVIENSGSVAADASDAVTLTDTFDPILTDLSVTFNGTAWTAGTNYTYDATTGTFATVAGQITVPAATYTQSADGTWSVTPGTATLTVTGTV